MYKRPELPEGADSGRYNVFDNPAGDDAYGRVTNADRFMPVVAVGRALIAHLEDQGASVRHAAQAPGDLAQSQHNIVDVVGVSTGVVRLTFVFTAFPGVILDIDGAVSGFPFCGCDHCDETVLATVEALERAVLPHATLTGSSPTPV
ncbi:DUF6226 family protein [Leifsonia sp. 2TAF2]|uniref:DUF6226 family protein n=1 Tax=Leifsonia sp. 2TAF2 TaxID=3233009 RepID=UPI003F9E284E